MLLGRRVAAFTSAVDVLRRSQLSQLQLQTIQKAKHEAVFLEKHYRSVVRSQRRRRQRGAQQPHSIIGPPDKLIFRHIPIALSRIERCIVSNSHSKQKSSTPSWLLPPAVVESLLEGLHEAESQRRCFYLKEREKLLAREVREEYEAEADDEESDSSRSHGKKPERDGREARRRARSQRERKQRSRAEEEARLAARKEDCLLLESSLAARPYLTARLWKALLKEELWRPIIQQRQEYHTPAAAHTNQLYAHSNRLPSAVLMNMLWCWSRTVVGVLDDVVRGGQPLSVSSPRFVVSLPSRPKRQREAVRRKEAEEAATTAAPALAMMELLVGNEDDGTLAPSPPQKKAAAESPRVFLRWMPRASDGILPLLVNTLGLWRLLLGTLGTPHDGKTASALLKDVEMMMAVQQVATVTYLLSQQRGAVAPDEEDQKAVEVARVLPGVLRETQTVLLERIMALRTELHHAIQFSSSTMSSSSSSSLPLDPIEAARLLIGLSHLQALAPSSREAREVLFSTALCIFPHLRTNTWTILMAKARQTSLLAFMQRSQRSRLRHATETAIAASFSSRSHHNSSVSPMQAMLMKAKQRSRLQQRQVAAALREGHLSQVQRNTVLCVAEGLLPGEIVALLRLLVAHLSEAQDEPNHRSGIAAGAMGSRPSRVVPRTSTMLMVSLLVAEAALLSHITKVNSGTTHTATHTASSPATLTLHDVADLWVALAVLRPIEQAMRSQQRMAAGNGGAAKHGHQLPAPHTSTDAQLLQVLASHTLHSLQELLGELCYDADGEEGGGTKKNSARAATPPSTVLVVLHKVCCGINQWAGDQHSYTPARQPSSQTDPLYPDLRLTAMVVKEVCVQHAGAMIRSSPQVGEVLAVSAAESMKRYGLWDGDLEFALTAAHRGGSGCGVSYC